MFQICVSNSAGRTFGTSHSHHCLGPGALDPEECIHEMFGAEFFFTYPPLAGRIGEPGLAPRIAETVLHFLTLPFTVFNFEFKNMTTRDVTGKMFNHVWFTYR